MGDFRNTLVICPDSAFGCTPGEPTQQRIFNPLNVDASGNRAEFAVPNVIDANLIDPIGQKLSIYILCPQIPTPRLEISIFTLPMFPKFSVRQYDIKLDHHFSDSHRISVTVQQPSRFQFRAHIFGDDDFGDGQSSTTDVHNISIEDNWSPRPDHRVDQPNRS